MIDRYSRKVMRDVWTEENKFGAYLEVEILSCEAWSKLGVIPAGDVEKIRENARFDVDRIKEIEEVTRHDVVAFTRAVSESLGEERKWVHYGLTSTDVVDTANGYLIKQADAILLQDMEEFLEVLRRRAIEFKSTPCIGRTHGIHADITSYGLKWALWYEEMKRNIERFKYASQGVEAGKMSGAVGNFANIPPFIQDYVCEKLGILKNALESVCGTADQAPVVDALKKVVQTYRDPETVNNSAAAERELASHCGANNEPTEENAG